MYTSFQGKTVQGRIPRRIPSYSLFRSNAKEPQRLLHVLINPRTIERVIVVMILLIFPIYVAWSFERSGAGAPTLTLEEDPAGTILNTTFTTLKGTASPSSEVFINDSPVILHDNGAFKEKLALHRGINMIEVVARRHGMSTRMERTIIYNP